MLFSHPFTALLCGPSGSGKTTFLLKLLEKQDVLLDGSRFKHIILVYKSSQSLYTDLNHEAAASGARITFIPAQDSIARIRSALDQLQQQKQQGREGEKTLIIYDDLGVHLTTDLQELIEQIFIRLSHHVGVSCIYLTQTLFDQSSARSGSFLRLLNKNAHYLILMKSPRGQGALRILLHQCMPEKQRVRVAIQSIREVLDPAFSSVIFDWRQIVPDALRIRTNIFDPPYPRVLAFPDEVTEYIKRQPVSDFNS